MRERSQNDYSKSIQGEMTNGDFQPARKATGKTKKTLKHADEYITGVY